MWLDLQIGRVSQSWAKRDEHLQGKKCLQFTRQLRGKSILWFLSSYHQNEIQHERVQLLPSSFVHWPVHEEDVDETPSTSTS